MCALIIYLIIKRDDKLYGINSKEEKCKSCGVNINPTYLYCPHCHEEVKKVCKSCGKLIDLDWRYCPFCQDGSVNNI
jgi:RNA polymerase subunit RPABC4/transcription elongation factor Spt4